MSALLPKNPNLVDGVSQGRGEGSFDARVDRFVSQLKIYYKDSRGSYRRVGFARLGSEEQATALSLPTGIRPSEVTVLGPATNPMVPNPVDIRTEFSVDYLLSVEAIVIESETALLSLTLDQWIAEGHGICMTW